MSRVWKGATSGAVLACTLLTSPTATAVETDPPAETIRPGARPTNVLVVVMDDVGVDKVGAYAQDVDEDYVVDADFLPDTPVLDMIAANGARFTQAWSNPTCSPTRSALYTGTHAFRTGIGGPIGVPGTPQLSTDETTLAHAMADAGYATGLFGKWHLGENPTPEDWSSDDTWEDHAGELYEHELHPNSLGFHHFAGTEVGSLDKAGAGGTYTDWVSLVGDYCDDCDAAYTAEAWLQDDYATTATALDAVSWIRDQDGPWLAVVAFHAAHTPLDPPPRSCTYRPEGAPEPASDIEVYEEIVECMDRQLGAILDGIDDLHDTLVIVVADNGTDADWAEGPFADATGKGSIKEGGIRVPMMVADGRWLARERTDWTWTTGWSTAQTYVATPGQELASMVHVQDIFATVASVGGADASTALDSHDLLPLLEGSTDEVRDAVYTEQFDTKGAGMAAVRVGGWKLVVRVTNPGGGLCRNSIELYDLASDRFELVDLSGDEPELVDELLGYFDEITAGEWADQPEC